MNDVVKQPESQMPATLTLDNKLEITQEIIRKEYLNRLDTMQVAPFTGFLPVEEDAIENIRMFRIREITYQKGESVLEKLTTVFNTLSPFSLTLFLLMDSDGKKTDFYLGIRSNETDSLSRRSAVSLEETLQNALAGHFPGIRTENADRRKIAALSAQMQKRRYAASVSVLANQKSANRNSEEEFIQGLEKLVFAMSGRPYTGILIAQSEPKGATQQLRQQYTDLYTSLSALQKVQKSETIGQGVSRQKSFSEMSAGQKTALISSAMIAPAAAMIGSQIGGGIGAVVGGQVSGMMSALMSSFFPQEQISNNTSQSTSFTAENKRVTELLKDLDYAIEQTYEFDSYGMWNAAAYFLSDDVSGTEISSSNFRSLMNGEKSGKQVSAINLWRASDPGYRDLTGYLSRFTHPLFCYGTAEDQSAFASPGIPMSGRNIGLFLGLPRQTVSGLPVMEHAEFGKEVISTSLLNRHELMPEERMTLGRIIDMGAVTEKKVELSNDSLTMHTFITGSTGSGKSNTVYQMLCELALDGIPFLVIEPAKGEYKEVFGSWPSVSVFSTNPKDAELIRLNPFRFPDSVHVLEHIDGLIEIFSACWPMYDAMPAFFKSAMLNAYEKCGWDLSSSIFEGKEKEYPDFELLADQIDEQISNSAYSSEIKSNYRGALLTRVRSLATGLNRFIFTDTQTPLDVLFDSSCILDISRVRSSETKSLIMGVMVYMLNEYRQDQRTLNNAGLRHVTVLEEAHNLLKNVQTEGSELVRKSVEMLTSTISEIRSYGEGFIIVDQSPSSVDLTAIKNTNTKIVLRTPEVNDRQAVGKSMGLNEEQIHEIARLSSGAAVVCQNDWASPVLTMIEKAPVTEQPYRPVQRQTILPASKARKRLLTMLLDPWMTDSEPVSIPSLRQALSALQIRRQTRKKLADLIEEYAFLGRRLVWESSRLPELGELVLEVLNIEPAVCFECLNLPERDQKLFELIQEKVRDVPVARRTEDFIIQILMNRSKEEQ